MKNLSLWVLTISVLSISCTNDFTTDSELEQINSLQATSSKPDKVIAARLDASSANLQIDNLLEQFYDQSNFDSASILAVNQTIHPSGSTTVLLLTANLNLTNSSIGEIRNVVSQSQGILELNVENSSMTLAAKASLSNFIENIMQFNDDDYESILQWVALYESAVSVDDSYTTEDKNIILTITSIADSSLFYEKTRKDKDWDTAVGNRDFIPTDEITFQTVRMALLAGIIQDNL